MRQTMLSVVLSLFAGFAGAFLFEVWQPLSRQNAQEGLPVSLVKSEQPAAAQPSNAGSASTTYPGHLLEMPDFVEASKNSTPSVVYIKTLAGEQYERVSWLDLFFNYQSPERKVVGSGSGVFFSKDGYIMTNNHVVEGAREIEVIYNRKTYGARLVGTDPSTDLALLKIEGSGFPSIKLASSREVAVGDWVLAVGNPFNLTSTVTAGIVSAKGRRINILEDIFPIESFIQTDAAINPGNSGGALVNLRGELVGINTAILSKTGSYAGYGFAVPSDIVKKVYEDLKQYGEVQKAFFGADVIDLNEEISKRIGTNILRGVAIAFLDPEGAAAAAGLRKGDVVTKIGGRPVDSKSDFDELLSYRSPGDKVQVEYIRENRTQEVSLTLLNIEGKPEITKRVTYHAQKIGAVLEAVPKLDKARLGLNAGVRIRKVERGLISQMNLEEGFIVLAINNYLIEEPRELEEILLKVQGRIIVDGIDSSGKRKYYSYRF